MQHDYLKKVLTFDSRSRGCVYGQNMSLHGVLCFIPSNLICNMIFIHATNMGAQIQSNLSYLNVGYPKLLGYSKTMDSPYFFPIIYCNKTTYYSNFDYPKNSIFRSDSSVPIKENAIKLPFKIRSPNVTHGDHDFFIWSSSIYTPE